MATFKTRMRRRLPDALAIAAAPTLAYGTGLLKVVKNISEQLGSSVSELQLAAGTLDISAGLYSGLTGRPRMGFAAYMLYLFPDLAYLNVGADHEQGLSNMALKTAAYAVSYGAGALIKKLRA